MSDTSLGDRFGLGYRRGAGRGGLEAMLLRGVRIVSWGVVSFALNFVEQVGEVLAPLVFTLGLVWWGGLKAIGGLHLDEQFQQVVQQVPSSVWLGDTYMTPSKLIWDGLLLMALVAACRTVNGIIAKET